MKTSMKSSPKSGGSSADKLEEVLTDEPQSNHQERDILSNNNKLLTKNAKNSISKNDFPEEVPWTDDDAPQQRNNDINKDKKQKDTFPEEIPISEPPSFRDDDLDKKQALGHQETIDVFSRESQEEEEASSRRPVEESQNVVVDGPGAYAIQGRETELLDSGVLTAPPDQETNHHQTSTPQQQQPTTQQVAAEATTDIEAFYRQNILQDTIQANVLQQDPSPKDETNTPLSRRFLLIVGVLVIVAIVIAVAVAVPLSNKRSRRRVVNITGNNNTLVGNETLFGNATTTTTILPSLEPSMSPSLSFLPSSLPSSSPSQQPFVPVTVAIFFDSRPGEVAWNLICGNVVVRDVPEGTYSEINGDFEDTLIVETFQVENGAPCQFTIIDRSGLNDGDGEGFYQVFLGERGTTSSILVGEGSDFEDEEQVLFVATPTGEAIWNQLGETINGEFDFDRFGASVSLSAGNMMVAIGAPWAGTAEVYVFDNSTWIPLGQVLMGESSREDFGAAVSLSSDGTILAVGGVGSSSSSIPSVVRVYRFLDSNQTWSQLGQDLVGQLPLATFGESMVVSLSNDGSRLVLTTPVGTFTPASDGLVQAYQYDEQTTNWTQLGQYIRGSNETAESFGFAAQLSGDGNVLAVGASRNSEFVRVLRYGSSEWVQMGQDITGSGGRFGSSVSLSFNGTILAVGAPRQGEFRFRFGGVRVFQYNDEDGNWTQLGQDIEGEEDDDEFGASVSLSDDGTVLAVGATESLRNGAQGGRAIVYMYNNDWIQVGQPFRSTGTDEAFGGSVSLSGDGNIVAVGASDGAPVFGNDTTGYASVFARID